MQNSAWDQMGEDTSRAVLAHTRQADPWDSEAHAARQWAAHSQGAGTQLNLCKEAAYTDPRDRCQDPPCQCLERQMSQGTSQ